MAPEHMTALVDGLERLLAENAFASVAEIRGRLDATHVERADMFFLRAPIPAHALSDFALHYPAAGRERAPLSQSSSHAHAH